MSRARTATAADFEKAADNGARAFWIAGAVAVAVWVIGGGWWALLPSVFALASGFQSVGASRAAAKLRAGTYPVPNINNGAPDGDARNYGRPTES